MAKKIIVYSAVYCPGCHAVKNFLKEHNIEFEERDIGQNEKYKKELQNMGHNSIPVTLIDDEKIVGFDVEKIKKALNIE